MKKRQFKLKWTKKENDWTFFYPDRTGKNIGRIFCGAITDFEKLMQKDWEGKPTGFSTFRQYLIDAGYNPDSLRITIDKITQDTANEVVNND